MALNSAFVITMVFSQLISVCHSNPICESGHPKDEIPVYKEDIDYVHFAQNLEFWEAEYFLLATYGHGLDVMAPYLTKGGPPPIGAQKSNLDALTHNIIVEFGNEEIGHLRAIDSLMGSIPRPLLNLTPENIGKIFDAAFEYKLEPPFDPYRDSLSYMLSCYIIPYVGMTGYVGINPNLKGYDSKHRVIYIWPIYVVTFFIFFKSHLMEGLLGTESKQDAAIHMYIYDRANEVIHPYGHLVTDFTARISKLRNRLGKYKIKDEGIIVPYEHGDEN
ncbi:unnamed protein product [Withania somnifera]